MIITAPWRTDAGSRVNDFSVPACVLTPIGGNVHNPAAGFEHDQILDYARPRWSLSITVVAHTEAAAGQLRAIEALLSMGGARLRAGDERSPRPAAALGLAGRPWLANPAVEASVVAVTATSLTVGGLAPGAVISPGDHLDYVFDGERRLFRVAPQDLATFTVPGSGQLVLPLLPRPRPVSVGATVRFDGARGVFTAVRGTTRLSVQPGPSGVSLSIEGALECR